EVDQTSATGLEFAVVQRHGFIRLPDDGYKPRRFHPRSGSFDVAFADYAAPLGADMRTRYVVRHRISKDEPLIYYVDPGIPEPVRSAVIEGASWWSDAFAAAGFPGVFRVELLPEDAHPLDVRYNVIQWVHRATRGWSYGFGVIDPRTGEIVKGHVSLGSLRVRQDRRIFEGLLGSQKTGTNDPDDPIQLALARIRQLAAHEVGHTLGFAHNFAASTRDRASVMDYPAPWVKVTNGRLDVSQAYAKGIGDWDKLATRYAYQQFEDDAAGLAQIIEQAEQAGQLFLSDADARAPGSAHPLANLWDNGADPVAELEEVLAVRTIAMQRFGAQSLLPKTPLAGLEEVFAPIYFYHRYQLEAATKSVGGLLYTYALKEEPGRVAAMVDGATQRRALQTILSAITPQALDIPEATLRSLLPRAYGLERNRELFASETRPAFDALGAARTAASMVISGLLQRERAARLIDQHRRRPELPGLTEVIDALIKTAFTRARGARLDAVQNEVQQVLVGHLAAIAADRALRHGVRAEAEAALDRIAARLKRRRGVHAAHLLRTIQRFSRRTSETFEVRDVPAPPPGSPIGHGWQCGHAR
ncbi:MAG: zinc-dependent metalloprotease, partial [Myxococcota bacterium]